MMGRLREVLVLLALLATSGCGPLLYGGEGRAFDDFMFDLSLSMGKTSPAVYGLDARVAPGFLVGDGDVTVHPTAAYSRSLFGGVGGETDNKLFLGAQVRTPVTESGIWLGGEAAYARRWTGFDSPGIETETTNGWTLTALAGRRLTEGFGTYVAAGVNKYGGSGPYARVGFELSP